LGGVNYFKRPLFLVDLVDFLIDWICSLFILYLMELRRDRKFDKIEEKSHHHVTYHEKFYTLFLLLLFREEK